MPGKTWLIGAVLVAGVAVVLVLAAQARRIDPALGTFDAWGGVPAWGQAVGGLRARLIADRRRYPVGDPMILILEIQNVGGQAVLLTAPHLMPSIHIPDEDRLPDSSGHNTFITAEPVEDGEFILHPLLQMEELVSRSPVRLEPNAVFTMIVRSERELHDQLEHLERVERTPQPRRADAHHWFAGRPGRYRLAATVIMPAPRRGEIQHHVREDDKGRWRGTLTTRPIVVDILEADDDKG